MKREVRYQGAIIENHHMLLIKHTEHGGGRSYWVIPGGGLEAGETEEQCVAREMQEETHLVVNVEHLLLEESELGGIYNRRKTFLCKPLSGKAKPGIEPETEANQHYAITEVRWFDLRDDGDWDQQMKQDTITFSQVQQIRPLLGYENNNP